MPILEIGHFPTKMKSHLDQYIRDHVKAPKEAEIEAILNIFEERQYSKGIRFKKSNTISRELGFLVKGSVRSIIVKKNGEEATGQISLAKNFVADIVSIRTQEPTPVAVEFLEDSSMLVAPVDEVEKLLEVNLAFNILIRQNIADRTVEIVKRQVLFMTGTAKERYQFILENNPSLLKRFPLRFIASMIGITPTQLSRIRNQK